MRRWGFARARLRTPEGGPAERFYEATGWRFAGGRYFRDDVGLWMVIYEKRLSVP